MKSHQTSKMRQRPMTSSKLHLGSINKQITFVSYFVVLFLFSLCLSSCNNGNQSSTQPVPQTQKAPVASTPDKAKETTFEEGLNYVRLGQFRYVMVISLHNGGVMSQEDFDYMKTNAPQEVNQWIKTEGGRRIVAGSNFSFKPEHLDALKKRFKVEDFSEKK